MSVELLRPGVFLCAPTRFTSNIDLKILDPEGLLKVPKKIDKVCGYVFFRGRGNITYGET